MNTVKSFGIVNGAEIGVFLELSCLFYDPMDVGNLISGTSAFSKTSLHIWKFTVHVLLKPGLENFEHIFKILQARLQQNMKHELPDVQSGFRKGRATSDQIAKYVRSLEK